MNNPHEHVEPTANDTWMCYPCKSEIPFQKEKHMKCWKCGKPMVYFVYMRRDF